MITYKQIEDSIHAIWSLGGDMAKKRNLSAKLADEAYKRMYHDAKVDKRRSYAQLRATLRNDAATTEMAYRNSRVDPGHRSKLVHERRVARGNTHTLKLAANKAYRALDLHTRREAGLVEEYAVREAKLARRAANEAAEWCYNREYQTKRAARLAE